MGVEDGLLERGKYGAKMTDEPTQHALGKGLLLDSELLQIAESYARRASVSEIDEQARLLLARRDALTDWEISSRARGTACFIFAGHRMVAGRGRFPPRY